MTADQRNQVRAELDQLRRNYLEHERLLQKTLGDNRRLADRNRKLERENTRLNAELERRVSRLESRLSDTRRARDVWYTRATGNPPNRGKGAARTSRAA
jgi:hypothetical protein